MEKGLVHVCYGGGPGKTTAAAGLCARARGNGEAVLFTQFLKDGRSGELEPLRHLGVEVLECAPCEKFYCFMSEGEKAETARNQRDAFLRAREKAQSGAYGLLALDEILDAVMLGIVGADELLDFLQHRPENLEVVLTGHELFPGLLDAADYATEMRKVKHPYDRGVKARKGIEY